MLNRVLESLIRRSRVLCHRGAIMGRETIDINACDESGYTSLFISAMAGRADSVAVLLAAGADHTIATKRGKTVLYGAVERGKLPVIEALLPYTTPYQLRQKTKFGTDVLHVAKRSGKRDVIDLLDRHVERLDAVEAKRLEEQEAMRRWGKKGRSKAGRAKRQAASMRRLLGEAGDEDEDDEAEDGTVAAEIDNRIKNLKKMAAEARAKQQAKDMERRARSRPKVRPSPAPTRGATVIRVGGESKPVERSSSPVDVPEPQQPSPPELERPAKPQSDKPPVLRRAGSVTNKREVAPRVGRANSRPQAARRTGVDSSGARPPKPAEPGMRRVGTDIRPSRQAFESDAGLSPNLGKSRGGSAAAIRAAARTSVEDQRPSSSPLSSNAESPKGAGKASPILPTTIKPKAVRHERATYFDRLMAQADDSKPKDKLRKPSPIQPAKEDTSLSFADRVIADANMALAEADAVASRLEASMARSRPASGTTRGKTPPKGSDRKAPTSPLSLPGASSSPSRVQASKDNASLASQRVPASRTDEPADDAAAARAAASRHMLERAKEQAKAHAERVKAASNQGTPLVPQRAFETDMRSSPSLGIGGVGLGPLSSRGQDSGWVGVGLQRLEAERAAEARIEARIREHRRARNSEEPPPLAAAVFASAGLNRINAPEVPSPVHREKASPAASPATATHSSKPHPTAGATKTLRLAAAAYGAPVVNRKKKQPKVIRRSRSDQPAIAML
jgi:hypothetical protein